MSGGNDPDTARKWRAANKQKVSEYKRRYAATHKAEEAARRKNYYAKNRDKILQQHKDSWSRNRKNKIEVKRASRAAFPDRHRGYQRAHRLKNPASWRLYATRMSAKKKGIAFDLDRDWFEQKLTAGVCELSGIQFDGGKRTPNSASVDRIDPKGPYTKENCRMIIWWLNRALSNLGEEYALEVFRAIFKKRGEIADYEDRMAA